MGKRDRAPGPPRRLSTRSTLIIVGLLLVYALLNPSLERWLGVDLPPIADNAGQDSGDSAQRAPSAVEEGTGPSEGSNLADRARLTEVFPRVFESTAGLRYRPGGEQGHRLQHILEHAADEPSRPVHGVFDGDQNTILAVIDEAFLLIEKQSPAVVDREVEDHREIYTINLGRRIGYVGGESGARRRHPAAHHLRLVLDGVNVITAFPVYVDPHR